MSLSTSYEKPGAGQKFLARRWPSTGLAVAALTGITLAFYHGLWLPGQVLIKRDAFRFYAQLKLYLVERLSAGELPQWFPYEALGRPFLGSTVTGAFHPFTALYSLLPIHDAYRVSTLLSCLAAALGAYAYGRLLEFSRTGSLVAGLSFALSGYVVSLTDNIPYLYSICMLPFFCAALEKALTGSLAWTVAPAVIWASVFLNGDVQTGYYYFFIALLWYRARTPVLCRHTAMRLASISGLAALLASVQLGPAWGIFTGTARADPTQFHAQALHWSTHPLRLLTVVISPVVEKSSLEEVGRIFFATQATTSGVPSGLWAESLYLGVPVVGLALLGARYRRDLRVLAVLAVLALLLALGRYGGIYDLFYHGMPLWSAFRYPEKFMGLASFAIAMLAGAGADVLRAGQGRLTPWLTATILCAGVGIALGTDTATAWTTEHFGAPSALASEVATAAGVATLFSAAATAGVWLLQTGARKGLLSPAVQGACLAMIISLDLARANLAAYHVGPLETATFAPPLAQAIAAREGGLSPGRFRLFSIPENKTVIPPRLTQWIGRDGAASVERRQALDTEHNAEFHVELLNVYLSSYGPQFGALLKVRLGVKGAARYNVAYYIGSRVRVRDPQFANTLVAQLPDFDLALFRSSVPVTPRAYLSKGPEPADGPVDPAALIARPEFLNGTIDVIEAPATALPGPALLGHAEIQRYAPEEVQVRVETPQPAVLILLDAYDKGWTATLENGRDLPIMRANALARAVILPEGVHVVTFRYETPLLRAGAAASLVGVVLCLTLIAHSRWHARRDHGMP